MAFITHAISELRKDKLYWIILYCNLFSNPAVLGLWFVRPMLEFHERKSLEKDKVKKQFKLNEFLSYFYSSIIASSTWISEPL